VRKHIGTLAALVAASGLAACTQGQTTSPQPKAVNAAAIGALQFAVGTVNYQGLSTGLNTVVTLRQSNGNSAFLVDTPTITGPAGFTVPAAKSAGTDAGTNVISSNPQTASAGTTTFGTVGGAFEYGFAPANITNSGSANYPQAGGSYQTAISEDGTSTIITGPGAGSLTANFPAPTTSYFGISNSYPEPFYVAAANSLPYLVGPPAVTDFHNANYPSGFLGYPSGFTAFNAPPVAGTYSLSVVIPNEVGNAATYTATGTLAATVPLPLFPTPVFADAAGGGGTVTYVLPAGVTNAILYAVDASPATGKLTFYSQLETASGTWTISNTQGPGGTAPFAAGDSVFVYAAGFDYNPLATGLGGPTGLTQKPTLPAQADVTLSGAYEVMY
jgi:hypothetical protein